MTEQPRAGRTEGQPAHVLAVDDSSVNRRLLERLLTQEGYRVTLAEDGPQALEQLRDPSQPVDVVLLDIMMPEMDGRDVLRHVKADPGLRHIPVIVLSAVEDTDTVTECIEAGAADYLHKPFSRSILRARLVASLAEKRLRDTELEYLEQVGRLTEAASALEAGRFEPDSLAGVAARQDSLGQLGRVFARMATEVVEREERLRRQVQELRVAVDSQQTRKQAQEITQTAYFQSLRGRVAELRDLLEPD